MRWERLFAELEATGSDDALLERDALVAELRDEEWGRTGWRDLLAGTVDLDVEGVGRLVGEVGFATEHLVQVRAAGRENLVATAAVLSVSTTTQRAVPAGTVARRLGWSHVLRALRDDGDDVQLVRRDGAVLRGQVVDVPADAVALRSGDRVVLVPLAVLASLSVVA